MSTTPDPTPDRLAETKATALLFLELISSGDYDELEELITDDWTMVGGPPRLPRGRAGLAELRRTIGPVSQTWQPELVLAENDLVAVRAVNSCRMESFFGVPARGVEQIFTATFVMRIRDGRIAFTWRNADDLGRLFQLGATVQAGVS